MPTEGKLILEPDNFPYERALLAETDVSLTEVEMCDTSLCTERKIEVRVNAQAKFFLSAKQCFFCKPTLRITSLDGSDLVFVVVCASRNSISESQFKNGDGIALILNQIEVLLFGNIAIELGLAVLLWSECRCDAG